MSFNFITRAYTVKIFFYSLCRPILHNNKNMALNYWFIIFYIKMTVIEFVNLFIGF